MPCVERERRARHLDLYLVAGGNSLVTNQFGMIGTPSMLNVNEIAGLMCRHKNPPGLLSQLHHVCQI